MDIIYKLERMAENIGTKASEAYLNDYGNIERLYKGGHGLTDSSARYYTDSLISRLNPSLKNYPSYVSSINKYFRHMINIKRIYRLDDDFLNYAYNYAHSVIKDNTLHGYGHPYFDIINNKIANKLSPSYRSIYRSSIKDKFYYKHARDYTISSFVGDIEYVHPHEYDLGSHKNESKRVNINMNLGKNNQQRESNVVDKPNISLSEKLKRAGIVAGIGAGVVGLAGLAAYGAYRLMKDRKDDDIEIGSPSYRRSEVM